MSGPFNGQILSEKLSKLNNSQQSIETLSHWCICHRKKAKQVVETWDKLFNGSQREQRVPFLYLANDILQNSRRKGSEFVHEFWKVLPNALKDVYENGDDHGKNVVSRLVDIWEERKVFGSRGKSLKDEMLSKDQPPLLLENIGKSLQSQSIKILRKDSHTIRLKLAVGSMPEKVITAFQSVNNEHGNEDDALNKFEDSFHQIEKMEKGVADACILGGNQQQPILANELLEHEATLTQCIEKLEGVELLRVKLVAQLKEAIQEQESKLELVRSQLQVAQAHSRQVRNLKQRLSSAPLSVSGLNMTTSAETILPATTPPPNHVMNSQPLSTLPATFAASKSNKDDEHKRAAAAVVAKLTASSSSAQMLSSILSSLAAEEAASMNAGLNSSSFTPSFLTQPPDKRPKLEKAMPISDTNNGYYAPIQQQQLGSLSFTPVQASAATSMQPISQTKHQQPSFAPPLPPLPPPPSVQQQFVQSGALTGAGTLPFSYGSNSVPPPLPPPLPSHVVMSLPRPATQLPPQSPPKPLSQPVQQHSGPTGFYHSPGIGFYGQSHPATPVSRP